MTAGTLKKIPLVSIILLFSFSPYQKELKTEYYYNLQYLKESSSPRQMTMIDIDNLGRNKPTLNNGTLFTYKNREVMKAAIAGNFSSWQPRVMKRSKFGVWYYFLPGENSDRTISYKFIINGIWTPDPMNQTRENDGSGSYVSLADPVTPYMSKQLTYRSLGKNTIEFRIYKPGARFISIVGDFNNWNPENDLLTQHKDGIWRLTKRIPRGTYRYKFIVDGEWVPDLYNLKSASDDNGDICSILTIE